MSNFIYVVWLLFQILTFAIFFRAILSWFMVSTRSPFVANLYHALSLITEPVLAPLRRIIPMIGMIDITPIVAIILLQIVSQILIAYI
jgi:YggT family protein